MVHIKEDLNGGVIFAVDLPSEVIALVPALHKKGQRSLLNWLQVQDGTNVLRHVTTGSYRQDSSGSWTL